MKKKLQATYDNIILIPVSEDDVSADQLESSSDEESSIELFKVYSIGPYVEPFEDLKIDSIVAIYPSYKTLFFNDVEYTFISTENIVAILR